MSDLKKIKKSQNIFKKITALLLTIFAPTAELALDHLPKPCCPAPHDLCPHCFSVAVPKKP
jgi:hypothetical protein